MLRTLLLHVFASVAVRAGSPSTAKRWIDRLGGTLRAVNAAEARRNMRWLMRLRIGTCLSRSVCVAALLPGAKVIIAVQGGNRPFAAHAWIELNGRPLMPSERVQHFHEIARLT